MQGWQPKRLMADAAMRTFAVMMIVCCVMVTLAMSPRAVGDEMFVDESASSSASDALSTTSTAVIHADVPYMAPWRDDQTQKLDIYSLSSDNSTSAASRMRTSIADNAGSGRTEVVRKRPLVVFIHGGAWVQGDKTFLNDRMSLVDTLLENGYLVASIDYRLATEAPWPAQINDCKSAIRFLRAHAEKYGIDTKRIVVFGESSGAHLAMMLGVTNGSSRFVNEEDGNGAGVSSDVQAVISDFGISDVDAWGKLPGDDVGMAVSAKNALFGVKTDDAADDESFADSTDPTYSNDEATQASPITYVSADAAPILLVHGGNDRLVSQQQSIMMEKALKQAGNKSVTTWYPTNGPHSSVDIFYTSAEAQTRYIGFLSKTLYSGNGDKRDVIPVYRFYSDVTQSHLFSSDINEDVIQNQEWANWHLEGVAFQALPDSVSGHNNSSGAVKGRWIHQLYNSSTNDYIYSSNSDEIVSLVNGGWTDKVAFLAPINGEPVYRLYSTNMNRHMLVTGKAEWGFLIAGGWTNEGVAFYTYTNSN